MVDRRHFIRGSATMLAGITFGGTFGRAQESGPTIETVMLEPETEKLVRLLEETPRDKCFEAIADRLHDGLTPRDFAAALFLAGVRNVSPHPLGFKFHCVLGVHAAYQLGGDIGGTRGLLPLFWMLDDFKASQEKDRLAGDYRMAPLSGKLPAPEAAARELTDALDQWDEPRADRAMGVLARTQGANRIAELLWRYGARDFRNIGHKATYVAAAFRVLETIGWQHAEPVLRSLAAAMTDFGHDQEVNDFTFESQCYLPNLKRIAGVDAAPLLALQVKDREAVTRGFHALLREAEHGEACGEALKSLQTGTADSVAIWDGVILAACDLIMRRRNIAGIHAVTSLHGLHHAYLSAEEASTRLLVLLQAVGWVCQFRKFMAAQKDGLDDTSLLDLQPQDLSAKGDALERIFAATGKEYPTAPALALSYARNGGSLKSFKQRARNLLADKTVEVHGWKYPAAVFELIDYASPQWRPHVLAASTCYLSGTTQADSPVMRRAKEALGLS